MKYPQLLCLLAVAGLLAGCMSVTERRISAHHETWQKLSAPDQQRLERGAVRNGDTEEMVLIALGRPDEVLPITSPDGQKQTEWLYAVLETESRGANQFDPNSGSDHIRMPISFKKVIFHEGAVVEKLSSSLKDASLTEQRARISAEFMLARLDRLVTLTPEQMAKARDIFAQANGALFVFSLDERPKQGAPIRVKMRADIRALLTAEQQAKYDATPQYLGGGSSKRT